MKKNQDGAITLEAAIFVPFFVMIMVFVNGLFVMFMGQQVIGHAVVQSAKSLAFDPYAVQRSVTNADNLTAIFVDLFTLGNPNYVSTDNWYEEDNVGDVVKERFYLYIRPQKSDAKDILDLVGVENGLSGLDFSECSVEDGVLTVKLNYKQRFVYDTMGLVPFERSITVKINLFEYLPIE